MATALIQPSFAAGELSPELFARVDLAKYKSAAALMRNFFVDYRGGASNRAGTEMVATLDGTNGIPRPIPFEVSTLAAYVAVFGDGASGPYIQFFADGAYITGADLVSPYAGADIPLLKYTQSADVLTIVHPSYPVYNLTRLTPTTFQIVEDVIGPQVLPPTNVVCRNSKPASYYVYSYVVTAVSANGLEESMATFPATCTGNNLDGADVSNNIEWQPSPTAAVAYYNVYKVGTVTYLGLAGGVTPAPLPTVYGYIGQAVACTFTDNNIAPDYSHTPPQFQDPFSPGQIASISVNTPAGGYTGAYTWVAPLIFTGGGGSGAAGYAVVDPDTGFVITAVLTNPGKGYLPGGPVVTDAGGATTYNVTVGQETGTYPSSVTYYQQRRVYAGTDNFPETLVASQNGNFDNFNAGLVSQASDSITVNIASGQDNTILSMVTMNTGMIVFTTSQAFLISGGNGQAAITPSDVVAYPQACTGVNNLPPLRINYDVLYCQARGATVRDFAFNFYVQSYTGTDRSVLASHLFLNHQLLQWTYAEEPYRQILVVREDGILLSFTYVPEQEIFAWTHYDTNGLFVGICSIPEFQQNAVYVVVERYIQGTATWTYFLERLADRTQCCELSPWFVDCALAFEGTPGNMTLQPSGTTGDITLTVVTP